MKNTITSNQNAPASLDKPFRLGLVSVTFREHTPKEILEAMRETGLSCVEWGSDIHAPCHDTERLESIAALQEEYGIACSSYGTYFRFGETPMEELEAYIRAAKILKTDVLRLWCGTKSSADYTQSEKETLFAQCKQAADLAARNGVMLCMECHRKTYTECKDDAIELMQTIHSPHFRMYWQPFQWLGTEANLEYARAASDFTEYLHVFNWKDKQRYSLSDAIEEWRSYLACFSKPRTLLLEFMPDDRLSTLSNEVTALRKIIGEPI